MFSQEDWWRWGQKLWPAELLRPAGGRFFSECCQMVAGARFHCSHNCLTDKIRTLFSPWELTVPAEFQLEILLQALLALFPGMSLKERPRGSTGGGACWGLYSDTQEKTSAHGTDRKNWDVLWLTPAQQTPAFIRRLSQAGEEPPAGDDRNTNSSVTLSRKLMVESETRHTHTHTHTLTQSPPNLSLTGCAI